MLTQKTARHVRNMAQTLIVSAIAVFAFAWHASAAEIPDKLELQEDEIHVQKFPTRVKSATAASQCIRVEQVDNDTLKITGIREGEGNLHYTLAGDTESTIEIIVGEKAPKRLEAIQDYLEDSTRGIVGIDTVSVRKELDKVTVNGTIKTFSDWKKWQTVENNAQEQWGNKILANVSFEPPIKVIEQGLQELVKDHPGMRDVKAKAKMRANKPQFTLNGTSVNKDVKADLEKQVRNYANNLNNVDKVTIDNNITVSQELIELEFTHFILSDSLKKDVGVDLLNEVGFNLSGSADYGTGSSPEYSANANLNIDQILNALKDNGYAAVKERQTISVQNNQDGSSHFGKEIKVRIQPNDGNGTGSLQNIKIGFTINATPTIKADGEVRLDLELQKTSIGKKGAQEGDYIINTARTNTSIDIPVKGYATLAVNKLETQRKGKSGVPVLRDIPVVNWLFSRRTSGTVTSTEGFLVTPRLKEEVETTQDPSVAENTRKIVDKINRKLADKKEPEIAEPERGADED